MKKTKLLLIVATTICFCSIHAAEDAEEQQIALCSAKFCEDAKCPEVSAECTEHKPNFNGIRLPFPGPCNCCPYCLEYLGLGDDCPIGEPSTIIPSKICGPGLTCQHDKEARESKCVIKADTKCTREQTIFDADFEAGNVGNLQQRPNCDKDGNYEPYKCIPGEICYCVDIDGTRIFGEIPYTSLAPSLLKCGCSRHNAKAKRFLGEFANTWSQVRCYPDGSFDPIQCVNGACLCVDGEDGKPTFPNTAKVNYTQIAQDSLECFNNKTHKEFDYYHSCEYTFRRQYEQDRKYVKEGYALFGAVYPDCDMDGNFAIIQKNAKEMFCADVNGTKIENYVVPLDSKLAESMNCKCARAKLIITEVEKPMCNKNGNYLPMQCKRGECRCVDEDGNQLGKEIDYDNRHKLPCSSLPKTNS